jgi:diguanylate cyclase (GGDEF)-like protein
MLTDQRIDCAVPGSEVGGLVAGETLLGLLRQQGSLRPVFQPIIDMFTESVLGFEVLTRCCPPFAGPRELFTRAGELGLAWEVEALCRRAAFAVIRELPEHSRTRKFFLNVSPGVFMDPRFLREHVLHEAHEAGLAHDQIVVEITEETRIQDYRELEETVARFNADGYQFALDDFGAGHSSLVMLTATSPHYLKLDMQLVRDIHEHAYKQHLVRSVLSFAESVESNVIAEGVETWEELQFLVKLGLRYVQGFLFARPNGVPPVLDEHKRLRVRHMVRRFRSGGNGLDELVGRIALRPTVVEAGEMTGQEVNDLFFRNRHIDHLVVLDGRCPVGLLTRQYFNQCASGPFGYHLLQRRRAGQLAKRNALMVATDMQITTLANLAMEREPDDLYDPVIVLEEDGQLAGTVTMKQLITRAAALQVETAISANPLTKLPGNHAIEGWLAECLSAPEFTVVYGDLDGFKAYNDCYGFVMGDEMIKLAADCLRTGLESLPEHARLGHVGGDDFVLVVRSAVSDEILQQPCTVFDQCKQKLFSDEHRREGGYRTRDRQGHERRFHLVTLSLAVISDQDFAGDRPHPRQLGEFAASLKKRAKQLTARTGVSQFARERRLYTDDPQADVQMRQQQKLESIGTLAGGVAHEINNPINGIMNYAQLIRDTLAGKDEAADEFAGEIIHEAGRVATIVRNLLAFARKDGQEDRATTSVREIVRATLTLINTVMGHDQIMLDVDIPDDLPSVRCSSQQIQQVLTNLLTNARDALNEKYDGHHQDKRISIRACRVEREPLSAGEAHVPDGTSSAVRVTVEDHGPGIPPHVQERMFEPFYTTKPEGVGTGLGLSISQGIVRDHGGTLVVETEPGNWTRFSFDLPLGAVCPVAATDAAEPVGLGVAE